MSSLTSGVFDWYNKSSIHGAVTKLWFQRKWQRMQFDRSCTSQPNHTIKCLIFHHTIKSSPPESKYSFPLEYFAAHKGCTHLVIRCPQVQISHHSGDSSVPPSQPSKLISSIIWSDLWYHQTEHTDFEHNYDQNLCMWSHRSNQTTSISYNKSVLKPTSRTKYHKQTTRQDYWPRDYSAVIMFAIMGNWIVVRDSITAHCDT